MKKLVLYPYFNRGGGQVLLVAVSLCFYGMQPHCVEEGLPPLPGAPHQRLGKALRGGAQALRLPVPQREGQRRESCHQSVLCKGGIQ